MDIDIDFGDRNSILELIKHVPATIDDGKTVKRHNTGVYCQEIPVNPLTGTASMDYRAAQARGYFKIDFLNMGVYGLIRDPAHYTELLAADPPWERLWSDSEWAKQLVHVGNYTGLLQSMRPDSIPRMAAFISIIRPGKAHLQNQSWPTVFGSVWDGDDSRGYVFKKAHALGYAALVALHMNLLNQAAAPA
jgi:hypothetical protein